jgi:hypothetical protein
VREFKLERIVNISDRINKITGNRFFERYDQGTIIHDSGDNHMGEALLFPVIVTPYTPQTYDTVTYSYILTNIYLYLLLYSPIINSDILIFLKKKSANFNLSQMPPTNGASVTRRDGMQSSSNFSGHM